VDQDGVVQVELRPAGRGPWVWILGLAALGALAALGLGVRSWLATTPAAGGGQPGGDEGAPGSAPSGRPRAPDGARRTAAARPADGAAPTAPGEPGAGSHEPAEAPDPEAADESDGPELRGQERAGVALFPARGTKPIKRGILVPDDFDLPPGYVRHFQTTDNGRMLPSILMFHPDYQPLDSDGKPIPLPADRVVPREMAPPGLPIEMLEVSKEDLEIEQTEPAPDQGGVDTDP
jgi:hypothetical protein